MSKTNKLLPVLLAALAVGVTGCSDSGGGGGGDVGLDNPSAKEDTAISSENDSLYAANSGLDADENEDVGSEIDYSLGDVITSFGRITNMKLPPAPEAHKMDAKAAASLRTFAKSLESSSRTMADARSKMVNLGSNAQETFTLPCDISGQVVEDITGSTDSNTGSVTIKFEECKNSTFDGGYTISNGKVSYTGSGSETGGSAKIVVGDGNLTTGAKDLIVSRYDGMDALVEENTTSMKITFKYSQDATNTWTWKFTGNGRALESDKVGNETTEMAIDNMSYSTMFSYSNIGRYVDFTLDGATQENVDNTLTEATNPDETYYLGFVDFHYTYSVGDTSTESFETVNGRVIRESSPAECDDGSYTFDTTVSFYRNNGVLQNQGTMTINGTTTLEVVGVDLLRLTLANGTVTEYAEGAVVGICEVAAR